MKKPYLIQELKEEMMVEKTAIEFHLENLSKIHEVIRKFDGKVANKRLYTALKEATGQHFGRNNFDYEHLNTEKIETYFNRSIKVRDDKHVYPTYYREVGFELMKNEKRIDAEKTIENVNSLISRLEEKRETYTFNEEKTIEVFSKIEKLADEVEKVLGNVDSMTGQKLRKVSYHIS